ncbi:MAG TPA: HAMP domain-containing sensor histidine kinase [Ramlibacter sp.]|uniref:sensor histidine kinase n=1 Tax=Ramlibacter sp. TaxID=1917967 RepID=UPI002D7EC403|nr:HAMP domain-containing sensor histidine kinase [Ramlibacter sp.]HET8745216.1 HAMP domain-containing sensor histidine kinase [Ramlibacter sp.]
MMDPPRSTGAPAPVASPKLETALIHPGPMAATLAVLLAISLVLADFGTWIELNMAVVYSLPLVFAAASGSRRLLWTLACALTVVTFSVYVIQIPSVRQPVQLTGGLARTVEPYLVDRALAALTILLTAAILHGWIHALRVIAARDHAIEEKNAQLEEANRQMTLQREAIVRQNLELQQRRDELEEISMRKTRMLAAISHDIRSPLQAITLAAEVIRRAAQTPALGQRIPVMAQRVQSQALSVVELLAEVMDMASFDSGLMAVHPAEFSLQELLAQVQQRLLPLADAKGLDLVLELSGQPLVLRTDKVKLGRILGNLVNNAIKFTAVGGVTLAARVTQEGTVCVSVKDTGCGIQPENIERIFGDFAQEDHAPAQGGSGWGLGLAISRRMSALLGAKLQVVSRPGAGSTFTVSLPPTTVVASQAAASSKETS